jgi:hypothetical protein
MVLDDRAHDSGRRSPGRRVSDSPAAVLEGVHPFEDDVRFLPIPAREQLVGSKIGVADLPVP